MCLGCVVAAEVVEGFGCWDRGWVVGNWVLGLGFG